MTLITGYRTVQSGRVSVEEGAISMRAKWIKLDQVQPSAEENLSAKTKQLEGLMCWDDWTTQNMRQGSESYKHVT